MYILTERASDFTSRDIVPYLPIGTRLEEFCSMAEIESNEVVMDRRDDNDRRGSEVPRNQGVPVAADHRQGERRKVQRRRQIDPTTCERDYSNDEIEFMQALDEYKRENGRMFPTCSES